MTKDTDDDEESTRYATPASPGVSTPHLGIESCDRRHLISVMAREIARRSAHLNKRLR